MSFLDFLKKDKTQGEPIEADAAQQEKEETGTRDVSGVVWPDMPPINPLRVSDRPMPDIELPKSAVIQPDRRDEVGMMLLSGELNPDTLRFLSVQELLLALTAVETWREQDLLSGAEDAYRKLFNEVINRIRGAERMFVLFDMSTGYPFIESGAALIFLEQDKAAHAMRLYSTQNRLLIVREVEGEGREVPEDEEQRGVTRTFFDYLYFLSTAYWITGSTGCASRGRRSWRRPGTGARARACRIIPQRSTPYWISCRSCAGRWATRSAPRCSRPRRSA